jgi:hypothetical protein
MPLVAQPAAISARRSAVKVILLIIGAPAFA